MHRGQKRTGFTIVELLIVVVVIAILAAITIVAFNGIQKRAKLASAQSDVSIVTKKVDLFNVDKGNYPATINDCPSPASTNLCLTSSPGNTFRYVVNNAANPPTYEITTSNDSQFYYASQAEKTGANEFLQYTDLAPMIDIFGLVDYKLTFDIKSANTSSNSNASVYMQNGSGAKYSFGISIAVTTTYTAKSLTFRPTLSNAGLTQSILAFYGTYGTGNILSVRNVRVQLQ